MNTTNTLLFLALRALVLASILFGAADTFATSSPVDANKAADIPTQVDPLNDFSDQYDETRMEAEDHYWAPADGTSESEKDFQTHEGGDQIAVADHQ